MGGLKLLIRAMSDMNVTLLSYEVRYGILQAGHYGTPPTHVRFCMVVANPHHALILRGACRAYLRLNNAKKGEPWCDALLAMSEDTFRALNDMGGDTNVEVDAWVVKGEAMLICEEWEDAVRPGPIGPIGAQ
ncbi:uncharacterized protein EDB93DRAFT_1107649 [Suillus bovinus]|uniref:uncharacterized protein n=1 Tax=Suillus bovinus TaxID=48563 RepID=UPI001B86D95C|nr:uncharacterized protein EDB93DRAFT_1107649 [Suillus bovinus]KAG2133182.1 hypothetical protein EDB93DRAFT_1107649 [Suillus bovinus]